MQRHAQLATGAARLSAARGVRSCQRATSLLSALAACALLGEAIDEGRVSRVGGNSSPSNHLDGSTASLYQICVFRGGSAYSRLTLLIFDFFAKPPGHDGYAFVI